MLPFSSDCSNVCYDLCSALIVEALDRVTAMSSIAFGRE